MRWAARLYRQAVRTPRPLARRRPARLRVESLEAREVPHVHGTAFIDLNLNGAQDAEDVGVAGVTVTATDPAGVAETVATGTDGSFTLLTDADNLRIEFANLPEGALPGRVAGGSGAVVRFLNAGADRTAVDLALASPQLVTTQFYYDDARTGANATAGAVLAVPYGADSAVTPTVLASVSDVGSVWGLVYNPAANALYASSFLKRHAGVGPAADGTSTTTGGIYTIDPTGATAPALLIDLNAAGTGLGTGADPHPTQADPDGDWFHDAATLPLVGKRGLGGLAISADGRTLYTVNLSTRQLLEIPLRADGTWDSGATIRRTTIPLTEPAGASIGTFNPEDLRPFAVAVRNGVVFVGVTYTAETSSVGADLRAFVYAFDPAQGAFRTFNQNTGAFSTGTAPVLIANLTYTRGMADDPTPDAVSSGDEVGANWRAWVGEFRTQTGQDGFPIHPSPWLTDIAFDGANMVLGVRDRFGDQGGFQTGNAAAGNEDQFAVIAVGDLLRAAPSGSGWVLESNGTAGGVTSAGAGNGQGPGGGEFYYQDTAGEPVPQEVATGGLAQVPGFRTIAATGNDPVSAFSGGLYTFFNSDPATGPKTAGTVFTRTALYESADLSTFGSANGLGDVAAMAAAGTVQVGDRVFQDANGNGLQDAGEPGISGVVLRLFQGSTEVDTATTGADGDFLFDDLQPNIAYQIRIDTTQAALTGRVLTTANTGANDQLDSDATLTGTTATVAFTAGDAGTSDHALDVGFATGTATTKVTIGNLVFRDVDGNGTFGPGDTGIVGVTVELLDQAGTNVLATTTTAAGGTYQFPGRDPGTFRVRLAAGNFSGSGPLVGFTPATPAVADPNTNADNDNNGTTSGTLGSSGFIVSGPVTVLVDGEPTTDGDDNDGNLTVDFGLVAPAATGTLTLGDTVFRDVNNDGDHDDNETGISGVSVELLDAAGSNVLRTTTTGANGSYTFAELAAGTYRVRLAPVNFNTGGVLFGFSPSGTAAEDPDNNVNKDSNGTASGTLGTGGFVVSGPITISANGEPSGDGDSDTNTNLTVDFGVVPATSLTLGNLVYADANGNGTFDTLEAGISGVSVQLVGPTGTVLQTTTTAAGGLYSFAGLAAGDYKVRLAATNFNTGGPLTGFLSFANSPADPDDNTNGSDDGIPVGLLGSGGYVESGVITLAGAGEPTTDGDADNNTNLTVDFAMVARAANTLTLGDRVATDTDNNGTLDERPAAGLAGVTVQLLNSVGSVVQTALTDTGGLYSFAGLAAGTYKVRLAAVNFQAGGPLVGHVPSSTKATSPETNENNTNDGAAVGTLGTATGFVESANIVLAAGTEPITDGDSDTNTNRSLDFAMVPPSTGTLTLGNLVFNDANNNGVKDASETGLGAVTVQLLTATGALLQTTTTAADGTYSFTNLGAGDYKLRLPATNFTGTNVLAGFASSTGTSGALAGAFEGSATPDPDSATDNDDNGTTTGLIGTASGFVDTGVVTIGGTTGNTNIDFGLFKKLSLGNVVFNDQNNNGTQDTSEPGIANVAVRLLNADASFALVATTTTNAQGQYLFQNLVPGNYAVDLADTNFRAGGPLFGFQSSTGLNAAFEPAPSGATDKQDHGTATGVLGSGGSVQSRTIALSATGPTGEAPNTDPNTPDAQTNLTVDFGLFQQTPSTASIAGRVFLDFNNGGAMNGPDSGLVGVTVSLSGGGLAAPITVQTDAIGNFTFNNLQAGTYTLTQTQPTTPANRTGKVVVGSTGGTAAAATNTISGIILNVNEVATGYNFAEVPLVSTGGSVYEDTNGNGIKDAGEPGIAGVTLTLTGTNVVDGTITPVTATTGSDGTYTFAGLTPGTYAIAEAQPAAYTDGKESNGSPAATVVTNDRFGGINLATATTSSAFNFGEVKGASLAGAVFADANDDGVKAATGEAGIAGVKVRLLGTDDLGRAVDKTTKTGTDGSYLFGSLRPGTYRVAQTQPSLYADGKETAGTANGTTTTNDRVTGIQLTSGTTATGYLFAEQARADLVMTMTPGTTDINPGGTVTLTYTLRNRGTAAATAAGATMNFGGLTFVSASTPAEFNPTTRTWTVGDLAAGATETIRLTFRGMAVGTFTPTARATAASELSTTNNRASATVSVGAAIDPPIRPLGGILSRLWFLSSNTNARRGR